MCIVFVLVSEIWHKVIPPTLAQGYPPPVFHDVAQGPHKVSDDIFRIKGITANRHIIYDIVYVCKTLYIHSIIYIYIYIYIL